MAKDQPSKLEIAKMALDSLPPSADRDEILAAVQQRLTVDRDVAQAEALVDVRNSTIRQPKPSLFADWLGCLLPLLLVPAFFLAMPVLFSLGERIVTRPVRTTATGAIQQLEYADGSSDDAMIGRNCRITADHLVVELPSGEMVLIPNTAYRKVTLETAP